MKKSRYKSPDDGKFHWSIAAMFIGFFFGIFTFAFIGLSTFVSMVFLSKALALFCFAGLLIPFRFYKKWFAMSKIEAVLFNIMAIGPVITALLLWINFLIRSEVKEEIFKVDSAKITTAEHFDDLKVVYTLENGAYGNYEAFRTFTLEKENLSPAEAQELKIKTAEGALGYKIFLGNEPVISENPL